MERFQQIRRAPAHHDRKPQASRLGLFFAFVGALSRGQQPMHPSSKLTVANSRSTDSPPSCDSRRRKHPSLQEGVTATATFPRWLCHLQQLAGALLILLIEA
jgi:hypothetical protein